jgi:hypothetical protein
VINNNHLVLLINFNAAKVDYAPTSKYINNQNSSDQFLKIKDIFSPKCQKKKMTLMFYSFLDDRTIKRDSSLVS